MGSGPTRRLAILGAVLVAVVGAYLFGTWDTKKEKAPNPRADSRNLVPPTETTSGSVDLVDETWVCRGPQDGTLVTVRISGRGQKADAVHLSHGCTGDVTLRVVIEKGWDCVKVQPGSHDLVVRGSCEIRGRVGEVHQDFVQAMGGRNVTFRDFETRTAGIAGQNGGGGTQAIHSSFFVNQGRGGREVPHAIVCEGCRLEGGGTPVAIGNSVDSGVRDSTITTSVRGKCVVLVPGHGVPALDPVDEGNTCVASARA